MSFGFDYVEGEVLEVFEALKRAQSITRKKKTVVFAAMSNEGMGKKAAWPARDSSDAIGVHSCNWEGTQRSSFTPRHIPRNSNFMVVGEDIPVHQLQAKGGGFCLASGTSFSTPIAVSMAALIMGFVNQKRCKKERQETEKLVRLDALWETWGMIRMLEKISEENIDNAGYSWIDPKLLWKDYRDRPGSTNEMARAHAWRVIQEALEK